jgi:hypothetical protein
MSDTPGRWTPDTPRSMTRSNPSLHKSISIYPESHSRKNSIVLKKFPIFKSPSNCEIPKRTFKALTVYEPFIPKVSLPPIRKDPIFGKTNHLKKRIKIKKQPQTLLKTKTLSVTQILTPIKSFNS